ncbi:MAG: hypothetical protein NTX36_01420, partial [Proteobacteria bacterium]|nr:hypothetical protein [Pseudomonadota bacterium]
GAIAGGTGTDTLAATDGTNAWLITGDNAGTLNTSTTFSAIKNLTGGSGADTFTGAGGSITGALTDPAGTTTLNNNITAGSVNLSGAVVFGSNSTINTSSANGNIVFNTTLDGTTDYTETLGLTAGTGNITFGGAVGGTMPLGAVTISSAKDVTANTFSAASLTQTTGTGTTLLTNKLSTGGAVNIKTNTINLSGAAPEIDAAGYNVNLNAAGTINGGKISGNNLILEGSTIGLTALVNVNASSSASNAILIKAHSSSNGESAKLTGADSMFGRIDKDGSPGAVFLNGRPVDQSTQKVDQSTQKLFDEAAEPSSRTLNTSTERMQKMMRNDAIASPTFITETAGGVTTRGVTDGAIEEEDGFLIIVD